MANQRVLRKRPLKLCAFCNNLANSKEHINPRWLGRLLPLNQKYTRTRNTLNVFDPIATRSVAYSDALLIKTGDPLSQRLKIVCQDCNRGWMSVLQERTKPILMPFVEGRVRPIENHQQHILVRWILMTAMVWEFNDYLTMGISRQQRVALRNEQEIPNGFTIFLGQTHCSLWKGIRNHFGHGGIHDLRVLSDPSICALHPIHREQSTTFAVNKLLVIVHSTWRGDKHNADRADFLSKAHDLAILHPNPEKAQVKITEKSHDQYSSDAASRMFLNSFARLHARPFWVT